MLYNGTSPAARSPLLRPQSEQPIFDIQSTERSGDLYVDAEIIASRSRYLYCTYCGRPCLSKAGKTNHEKAHVREIIKEKRAESSSKPRLPRMYSCKECDEQFVKRRNLNEHMKTHNKLIECNYCHKKFKDRMEFDLHDAISDGVHFETLNTPAHRTRSQSRLSCHGISQRIRSVSCDGNFYNGAITPVSDITSMSIGGHSSSRKRTSSRASGLSMSSKIHRSKKSKSIEDWIENNRYMSDDDDDEFSDSDSVHNFAPPSRPMSRASTVFTQHSDVSSFTAQSRFLCSEDNCMKTFPSLNWVTTHEMVEHKKLALYRCGECRKRFTTSGNLHQHRINTHPNVIICVLCDNTQKGIAAIEEHFQLHQKYSVKCDVCGKMFLNKFYLDQHLKRQVHYHKNYVQTKAAILIRIDRRETRELLNIDRIIDAYPNTLSDFSYTKMSGQESVDTDMFSDFVDDSPWRS